MIQMPTINMVATGINIMRMREVAWTSTLLIKLKWINF